MASNENEKGADAASAFSLCCSFSFTRSSVGYSVVRNCPGKVPLAQDDRGTTALELQQRQFKVGPGPGSVKEPPGVSPPLSQPSTST